MFRSTIAFVIAALLPAAAAAQTLSWDPGHTPATPSGGAGGLDGRSGGHGQLVQRHNRRVLA